MSGLFASGRIVDLILVLVAVEVIGLFLLRRRIGRGPYVGSLAANLAAGVFLLLALRAALVEASWRLTAACLAAALAAHVADQLGRWRA